MRLGRGGSCDVCVVVVVSRYTLSLHEFMTYLLETVPRLYLFER
jgi:hypothetical protein